MTLRVGLALIVITASAIAVWIMTGGEPFTPRFSEPIGTRTTVDGPDAPRIPGEVPNAESARKSFTGAKPESHVRDSEPDDQIEDREVEDPTGDLELYEARPMSSIPHRVARAWGARGAGSVPGVVGAYVVVDAGLSDEDLTTLARDIRAYHDDARAMSVRIVDSEQAATYDRHRDGGELAAAHLVGQINRNESLGTDRIEIRGQAVDVPGSLSR